MIKLLAERDPHSGHLREVVFTLRATMRGRKEMNDKAVAMLSKV